MRIVGILALLLAHGVIHGAPVCGGHGDRASMLVSTKWLAEHLKDPELVILTIGQKSDFDQAHIPGAQYLDYSAIGLKATADRPNSLELPPMADLAAVFGSLGISNSSRIVLYVNHDLVSPTTRVYLTLDAMGLGAQTSLLDGGWSAWQSEGRPVTAEARPVKAGKLTPCPQSDVVVDVDYVKSNLRHNGVHIVDARTPNYYSGETPGRSQRLGHIPGATNVPYQSVFDEQGKLKPVEALQQQFREAGVKTGDRVVTYCHIGQQATVVYFVARYLGYDARLYDGSFEDWSRHSELPVEK
jgi:thiosulfate/3-mercaptopyruvate sulfurtransferase